MTRDNCGNTNGLGRTSRNPAESGGIETARIGTFPPAEVKQ
jgi:hypothetical protein